MTHDKKIVIRSRAIILHDGRLLVLRHHPITDYAALPGGHLEYGEDVKECLHRELIEELGVEPKIGKLLYINTFIEESKQSIEFFFHVTNGENYKNSIVVDASHRHEFDEIHWLVPDDEVRILPKSLEDDFKNGKIISNEVRFIND